MNDVANSMRPTLATAEFQALSEYTISGQGFKMSGVLLYPVVYEFCAQWEKARGETPANFEDINRYCGMRLLFQFEQPSQLAGLPQDHVTRFDLVLNELISRYGEPDDIVSRGREMANAANTAAAAPRRDGNFRTWRWCPTPAQKRRTSCKVSIVLAGDPDGGRGIVIFATPALWRFAEARETSLAMPDPLYTLLQGLPLEEREAQRQIKPAEASAAEQRAAAESTARESTARESSASKKVGKTVYDVTINEE